jgi:hypothetical protein
MDGWPPGVFPKKAQSEKDRSFPKLPIENQVLDLAVMRATEGSAAISWEVVEIATLRPQ